MRLALPTALFLSALLAASAVAQPAAQPVTTRVDRLEKEMRAVQRKIFPGGAGMTIEPEIQPTAPPPSFAGTPADSAVSDLTSRVDAVEKELARVTGQVEQNSYEIRQLKDALAKWQASTDGRLKTLEGPPPETVPEPTPAPAPIKPTSKADIARAKAAAAKAKPGSAPPIGRDLDEPKPDATTADDRPVKTAASGDPAEDAYLAASRLWVDKRYPEAETALKAFLAKYPKHKRTSYAQNLLGRALLDDGQPASAAIEFVKNYKSDPHGERAPDSLYFLGQSLMALKPPRPADACKAYGEMDSVYGAKLSASLKTRVARARTEAKCS